MEQNLANLLLSDLTHFMKYAQYLDDRKTRETFQETVQRNMDMHIKKFPFLKEKIQYFYNNYVITKKVLPSMRSLQFGGPAIEKNNARMFNCSYAPIQDVEVFREILFLLLSGSGFGYSVQERHINKLPPISTPLKSDEVYYVEDSIEGWADALDVVMQSYFGRTNLPILDYSKIRKKGMRLITSGGKAPGKKPLINCLNKIQKVINSRLQNINEFPSYLSSVDIHSIVCHIADAVLAGGIRRASLISFFDDDDIDMLTCKHGEWWKENPHFGRCNNSVVLNPNTFPEQEFKKLWKKVEESRSGEPGVYWTNNPDVLANPCVEASLRPYSFCNLTEINASMVKNKDDFYKTCEAAAFINTLQASYTDFHYLRDIWKKNTDEDALIGVGITGLASGNLDDIDIRLGAEIVKKVNKETAELIGINPAARCTLIKPAGTSSLVLSTSSGAHSFHSFYWIRRIRINKQESIYAFFLKHCPDLLEEDQTNPDQAIICFPQKAPDNAETKETASLEKIWNRVMRFNMEWCRPGHNRGDNYHNVSATISVQDDEWETLGKWVWENRFNYHGISVLPFDGGTYIQAPFEACTKEKYEELLAKFTTIDLSQVVEEDDFTNLNDQVACAGGVCELH